MPRLGLCPILALCLAAFISTVALSGEPIKVFILAGQSNMEGKAKMSLLEYQATASETKEAFSHLRDENGWIQRDDVWIKFLDRHGKLTVGFGSPNCIGPELQFGWTVGDYYHQPVLIIKTAWGGKSLFRDFRPPSSGLPNDDILQELLQRQKKRSPNTTLDTIKQSFGHFYREMIKEVETTLGDMKTSFPDYEQQGYALALFDPSMWAKHPYVVLHELAHSYHDQVLSFDDQSVIDAYQAAKESGIYEQVLLYTGRQVQHYGLSNHKEYFAESTEAYFGVNDFYPFVRAELKEHDPRMSDLMKHVWGKVP